MKSRDFIANLTYLVLASTVRTFAERLLANTLADNLSQVFLQHHYLPDREVPVLSSKLGCKLSRLNPELPGGQSLVDWKIEGGAFGLQIEAVFFYGAQRI
jgi:hypothetical protein